MNLSTSVLDKIKNPFIQALIVLVMFLVANGVVGLLNANGFDAEERMPWTLSIAFLLLFMVYNAMIGLLSNKIKRYWLYSIYAFAGLMFTSAFFAGKISGILMDEAGSYRWLFFVFCPVYLFFIVMVSLIKKIVELAEKDDTRFDKSNHNLN
jgi:hypothetical protein